MKLVPASMAITALLGGGAFAATPSTGEYLTRAADCVACHTAEGGQPYTGGRAFKTPFGVLYSPNITPDKDTGIGNYTDDEWVDALQRGVGHGGKHLYPVMPYDSYTLMTRDDALAIKQYMFSLAPVHATAPENALHFPFSQRWTLWFWNQVNNPAHRYETDTARSPEWNRGAYLVNAVAHCGQCHTPRNWMQGLSGRSFAGALQQGWVAYNITSDRDHGIGGWSDNDLVQYLSSGTAPHHGPASGPMAEAVTNSLRFLTQEDVHAMVAYLRTVDAQPDGPAVAPPQPKTAVLTADLGNKIFADACAGCHLPDGAGRQSSWAALAGDHSTADPKARNVLQVLAHGSEVKTGEGWMFMHSFAGAYTDPELAAVANYVVGNFGGQIGEVTAKDVASAK